MLIAENANPPVCKIISYSKFLYLEEQKIKSQKNHRVEIKEIRLTPRIEENDLNTKIKHIRKFILSGDKVKVSLLLKGRENSKPGQGEKIIATIIAELESIADLTSPPSRDGRGFFLTLSPKK